MNPIDVRHLLPPLHDHLIILLRSIDTAQWHSPTVCPRWSVKDIAAHLLDTTFRRLGMHRDGFVPSETGCNGPRDGETLLAFLNRMNEEWILSARRLSPDILVDLLDKYGRQQNEFLASLDPNKPAFWPVAWAGESASSNWFDVAREYTERWLHQQQIRDAVGASDILMNSMFYRPLLEIFTRAIPHNLRALERSLGSSLVLIIPGEAGGSWCFRHERQGWSAVTDVPATPDAVVTIPPVLAWKLFSKAVRPVDVSSDLLIHGDWELGQRALETVSVMA